MLKVGWQEDLRCRYKSAIFDVVDCGSLSASEAKMAKATYAYRANHGIVWNKMDGRKTRILDHYFYKPDDVSLSHLELY